MKTCTKCGELKALDAFVCAARGALGLASRCRQCQHVWRQENKDLVAAGKRIWAEKHEAKEKLRKATLYAANREAIRAAQAAYRKRPENIAKQARRVRDGRNMQRQQDLVTFNAKLNAQQAKRQAAKNKRTPPWADLDAIRAIYEKAARIAELTGEPVHVDHDIPLRGKLVSGLHVHTNLVIRHATENLRKSNHFEVA